MNKDQKVMMGTKFGCNKRYSCAKSLAGHVRADKIGVDLNEEDCSKVSEDSKNEKGHYSFEGGGSSGYSLRMNPKKTRRFMDSSSPAFHEQSCSNMCKECGKCFQSLKALCGHMACHSEKASGWSEENEDVTDQIGEGKKQSTSASESDQSNGYSSISEIEQEQEELANCLMMLSRDDHGRQAPNSSDSLVLESKSSPICVRVRAVGGLNSDSRSDENMEMEKLWKRKLKSSEVLVNSHKHNSGYLRYEDQNLDSGSSIYEHTKINKLVEPERGKDISNAIHLGKKYDKRTEHRNEPAARNDVCHNPESPEDGTSCARGLEYTVTNGKQKHQCDICYKLFDSNMALSGHKSASSCHRKVEPSHLSQPNTKVNKFRSSKNLSLDLKKKLGTKKSYRHECPICFRVFNSGQALGGHKRSHFLGSSEDRSMAIDSKINKVPSLIDLNLPAPPCSANSASFHF